MRKEITLAVMLSLFGCGRVEEKKNSLVESVIKQATGIDADIDNILESTENRARVELKDSGLDLNQRFKNGFATITVSKETIAITISADNSGQDNILIGFTGKDLTRLRPIKGELAKSGENSMSFSTMNYRDNNMEMMTSFNMSGEIVSLNLEKTVIEINGNIGYPSDAESRDKWKHIEGTIELNRPVFQSLGSAKEDFMY